MRYVRVIDKRTGESLAEKAGWYASPWRRFQGLMLRSSFPEGEGIVLIPCNSVHMALMRFPLDILFFNRRQEAVRLVHDLKPYRIAFGHRGAHAAIELPAGTLRRLRVEPGDLLVFEEQPDKG
ncbi:MAG: DUF192 domain-containing protein [Dehalococcoidia bacterium]